MRIVCQQVILMKYHAVFVNFEKEAKFKCAFFFVLQGLLEAVTEFVLKMLRLSHFTMEK